MVLTMEIGNTNKQGMEDKKMENKEQTETKEKIDKNSIFYPRWKDSHGNILLIMAKNHVFDSYAKAQEFQITNFLWYIPFGLTTDGILELEEENTITYCEATLGMIGKVALIEGPEFNKTPLEKVLN